MCNLYDIGPTQDSSKAAWENVLSEALQGIAKLWNIRKTDPGVIVRLEDGVPRSTIARWGIKRGDFTAINNVRDDKLATYWKQLWHDEGQRCLIPASAFYEWTGSRGHKRTHAIYHPDHTRLWMAGLWEEHAQLGLCFTTLTTSSNAFMKPIHEQRMPVLLHPDDLDDYLTRDKPIDLVRPYEGRLTSMICENPLQQGFVPGPPVPVAQKDLF